MSRVVGVEESARRIIAAGHPGDDLVAGHQGRGGDADVVVHLAHLDVPADAAIARVEGHQVRIERAQVQRAAEDGDAAVHRAATIFQLLGKAAAVMPQLRAGAGVDGEDVVPGGAEVEDAVDEQGRGLQAVGRAGLKAPRGDQVAHVGAGDFPQGAETLVAGVAAVHQPLVGYAVGIFEAVPGDVNFGRDQRIAGLDGGVPRGGADGRPERCGPRRRCDPGKPAWRRHPASGGRRG